MVMLVLLLPLPLLAAAAALVCAAAVHFLRCCRRDAKKRKTTRNRPGSLFGCGGGRGPTRFSPAATESCLTFPLPLSRERQARRTSSGTVSAEGWPWAREQTPPSRDVKGVLSLCWQCTSSRGESAMCAFAKGDHLNESHPLTSLPDRRLALRTGDKKDRPNLRLLRQRDVCKEAGRRVHC